MVEFSPNRYLFKFLDMLKPQVWTSKQAERIYEAAIEAERRGDGIKNAVSGSVRIVVDPAPQSPQSPYGTAPEAAKARALQVISRLRHEADYLENDLNTYGPEHFIAKPEAVEAPKHPSDIEGFLIRLMQRADVRIIWVHGVKFVRDASRAFGVDAPRVGQN